MNLIVCGEKCRHQKDGYCCLEGGSQVTSSLLTSCCHFEEPKTENITGKEGGGIDTH